jgi:hypothetical protein
MVLMEPLSLTATLDLAHECNAELAAAGCFLRLSLSGDDFWVCLAISGDGAAVGGSAAF